MTLISTLVWESVQDPDYFGTAIAYAAVNGFRLGKVDRMHDPLNGYPRDALFAGYTASHQGSTGKPNGTTFLGAFQTEDAARDAVEKRLRERLLPWLDCRTCGAPFDPDGVRADLAAKLRKTGWCLNCHFFEDHISRPENRVVIKGTLYRIGDETEVAPRRASLGGWGLGCGGREFEIEFTDGRRVISHNLWVCGDVPAHFRDRLPDDARFVPRERNPVDFPFIGEPGGER